MVGALWLGTWVFGISYLVAGRSLLVKIPLFLALLALVWFGMWLSADSFDVVAS